MYSEALKLIEKYDVIIIHRHSNPDGDAIGSQVGLKWLLKENFPQKTIYTVGDAAKRYSFIEDSTTDEIPDCTYDGALAIILDTSAHALISDGRYKLAETTLRIDHHMFCEKVADVEVADPTFESCCGLITFLSEEWNWKMPTIAAQALFTGLVTDSGRFRYDSTTSRTFSLAGYLMRHGVRSEKIYAELYADDFEQVKMRARFVMKIQFTKHNVAYIYTPQQEWQEYGLDSFTVSRGMVGTMADLRGVHVWINMTETEKGIVCELRSNKYDINKFATAHGGGGHAKACGCTVKDYDEAMQLLNELDGFVAENQ